MAVKRKQGDFTVSGRVLIEVGLNIKAGTMEEALEQARNMGVTDFVDPKGDHMDSSLVIAGVWDNDVRQTL